MNTEYSSAAQLETIRTTVNIVIGNSRCSFGAIGLASPVSGLIPISASCRPSCPTSAVNQPT